jgi:hypothetical protein
VIAFLLAGLLSYGVFGIGTALLFHSFFRDFQIAVIWTLFTPFIGVIALALYRKRSKMRDDEIEKPPVPKSGR